jgi:hypothetical protein
MFGCSSARLARGWQRDSRNTRLRSGLPGGRGRANAADRLQVSVRSQLSLPCVCVSFMRDKTQSSNVSRIVWDCQTSERTAFGWRGRLDEGMHSAHKPRTCVHHKQATLLTACELTCWSALSIRSQFARRRTSRIIPRPLPDLYSGDAFDYRKAAWWPMWLRWKQSWCASSLVMQARSLSRRCMSPGRHSTPHAVRCTACKLQSEGKGTNNENVMKFQMPCICASSRAFSSTETLSGPLCIPLLLDD